MILDITITNTIRLIPTNKKKLGEFTFSWLIFEILIKK